jgi:hypothetical protein
MGTAIRHQSDFWPEHETEQHRPQPQVVAHSSSHSWLWNLLFGVQTETRVGSLIAAAGLMMAAKTGTMQIPSMANFSFPPGPLELCGIGMLVWLHAKWRRASRPD